MTYQEWCIEAINVILKMENQDKGQFGYKMILKDIIRHYPEVFMSGGKQMHFWSKQISKKCMEGFRRSFVGSLIMTKNARDVAVDGSIEDIQECLYQEHISPVQYVFKKLENLRIENKICTDSIRKCMVQNKLVLLYGEEKKLLDGKRFTQKDHDFLSEVLSEVHNKSVDTQAELEEANTLIGKSSTDRGSGLFRICKLLASGVQFVDVNGEECSNEHLVECLVRDLSEYATS